MEVVAVILARAGSKGLPDKCVRGLLGRPVITYTFHHAQSAKAPTHILFTTDSKPAAALAKEAGIEVVERPPDLANDKATVDAAARHAIADWERRTGRRADIVVLLYGNIPVRPADLIDRAVEHLRRCGGDSVRSVAPVSKHHPDWIHRLAGDRMIQFRKNSIYRRQDLEPLFYHDGGVAAVMRAALFGASPDDHQSFLGQDRRGIVLGPEDVVDIDGPVDLYFAEAVLRGRDDGTEGRRDGGVQARLKEKGDLSQNRSVEMDGERRIENRQSKIDNRQACHIGTRLVGPGHPTFVIAEAGVNHNGDVETALRMIDAAAQAGADAVKFQMFRADDLASADAPSAPYQLATTGLRSQREMLRSLELGPDDLARLWRRCEERGIVFLATPFGVREVQELVKLGAPAVKLASTDLTNVPLVDAAVATGLPLILSTGAATADEIRVTVGRLGRAGAADRLILLHCVSCYPTPLERLNLAAIASLHREFGVPCGLSDHTTELRTGGWAVAAGACVVEKHFTLDQAAIGPDHAMSLNPEELARYVAEIRMAERTLGHGRLGMNAAELPVRDAARRSVAAARPIAAGTILSDEHICLKRPGTGIDPGDAAKLLGRRARRDIPADALIAWDMIQ